jgi:Rrf2 family protein
MKLLSQGSQYAISAVISLSKQSKGATISAAELAKPLNCPAAYLSQILSKLKPSGIVNSRRGKNGGVYLARNPKEITLLQVIRAIDGDDFFTRCFLGIEGCGNIEPCPFHKFWSRERGKIQEWLSDMTFDKVGEAMSDEWFDLRLHYKKS